MKWQDMKEPNWASKKTKKILFRKKKKIRKNQVVVNKKARRTFVKLNQRAESTITVCSKKAKLIFMIESKPKWSMLSRPTEKTFKPGNTQKRSKKNPLKESDKKRISLYHQVGFMIENVIGSIKTFRIITKKYRNRNRRKRLTLIINLIAGIYNYQLWKRYNVSLNRCEVAAIEQDKLFGEAVSVKMSM